MAMLPNVVNERVFRPWDYVLFTLLTGLSWWCICSFLAYWFSFQDWLSYPITFPVLTLMLIGALANAQLRWFLLPCMRRPRPAVAAPGWKVGVITTFVPDAEPIEMLEETVGALIALDYPHDTWVLDEEDDDRVKALCLRLGAYHFSRKRLPQYQTENGLFRSRSRHGNYNAWLYEIGFGRYEIITQFDPDHVPNPTFLSQVLGYFEDSKIGYVQAAQVYYNQEASFIARGAAEETYAHYSSTQMASYAMGYPVVTGCHSTHRVAALRQVGGFAPHDADDVLITFLYRSWGWQGVYVPRVLALGLTPVDWKGYLIQQLKWARSVLDIKFWIYPRLSKGLPLRTRVVSLLHGLSYVQSSLFTLIGLFLTAFMLMTGTSPGVISFSTLARFLFLWAVLQLCDFYRQRFYLDWRNESGFHWRAMVLRYAKWPYLLLALFQVLVGHRAPFPINPKVKNDLRRHMLLWPHLCVGVLMCAAAIISIGFGQVIHPLLFIWAAVIVIGSLALVVTEYMDFPEPYEKWRGAWQRRVFQVCFGAAESSPPVAQRGLYRR
jgi:cellulose synthase (UDP-forming)